MSGIPIGRLFGISLRVHWSWFIIALLIASSFALGALPEWHSWSSATNWLVGIGAAIGLFASILLHELAHSIMANRLGTMVDHITFFIFGGVSNLHHEPDSARNELLITVVGPLTSYALAILLLGSSILASGEVTPALETQSPALTLILWLGEINLVLAIFNCMPGFPLDGGRILRAVVWARTQDLGRATRVAARTGRVFSWMLIATGIAMLAGVHMPWFGAGIGGIWLAAIGYFLMVVNIRSEQSEAVSSKLSGVPVRTLMRAVHTMDADVSIQAFVDRVLSEGEHAFCVTDRNGLRGIACAHDAARTPREEWTMRTLRSITTPADRMATTAPDAPLSTALDAFQQHHVNELVVLDDGRAIGLLQMRDMATYIQLGVQSQTTSHSDA